MPMYTYACVCGWSADLRGKWDVKTVPCSNCARDVRRAEVNTINYSGFTKTPPSERDWSRQYRSFTEASSELEYAHSRQEEAAGKKLAPPPLFREAKARASKLAKAGVTVDDLS